MHIKILNFLIIFSLSFFSLTMYAQESINTSGSEASGISGTVNYSVGQVTSNHYSDTSGSLHQGVQQTYEVSVITKAQEARNLNIATSVFPNPTSEYLMLETKTNSFEKTNIFYELYDNTGQLLLRKKIINTQSKLDLSDMASAIYYIKVIDSEKTLESFKIVKKKY